jgi:hypothetical protein
LGDTVAFNPVAQGIGATQTVHVEGAPYDPILQAQMLEAQCKAHAVMDLLCQPMLHKSSRDSCLEKTEEGVEGTKTVKVNNTDYWQPDTLIPDHPVVTNFLPGQGRIMNYRGIFNDVKHAKAFCRKHFKGLDLQEV